MPVWISGYTEFAGLDHKLRIRHKQCVVSERINDRIRDPFTAEKYIPGGYVPQLLKPAEWSPQIIRGEEKRPLMLSYYCKIPCYIHLFKRQTPKSIQQILQHGDAE